MGSKYNININGVVQGQVIGDCQTVVQHFNVKVLCDTCHVTGYKMIVNGVQICSSCKAEIKGDH
jgi:ribosomal protein L37AE/L43A